MTPEIPAEVLGVYFVVNTDSVLLLPAWITRNTARTRNTPISNTPRIVPSRAETRTPNSPASSTIAAPARAHGHHRSAG